MNLKGNDFLKLLDYSPEQIDYLLQLPAQGRKKGRHPAPPVRGQERRAHL